MSERRAALVGAGGLVVQLQRGSLSDQPEARVAAERDVSRHPLASARLSRVAGAAVHGPAGADLAEGTIWPRRARVTLWSSVGENYAKMNEGELGR
eukprot:COSAG03_NODE_1354_length_4270_cov_22.427236_4_plen_96_part_00